jgi:hypothetical protein
MKGKNMLILNSDIVKFDGDRMEGVLVVALDRRPEKEVVEHDDLGPHATFADVPEQRVEFTIRQELRRGDLSLMAPGDEGLLELWTAPGASEAGRRKLSATVVCLRIEHDLSKRAPTRTMRFIAISASSATDPVTIADAEAEV